MNRQVPAWPTFLYRYPHNAGLPSLRGGTYLRDNRHMRAIALIPPTEARSRNMSAIRSVNTRPELAVRRSFHRAGLRFHLHRSDLPGKPDVVFPKHRVAVFIHGCFWHGHVCREARRPQSNLNYWNPKIDRNVTRDDRNAKRLRQLGWAVFIIRECRLSDGINRVTRKMKTLKAAKT